MKIWRWVVRDRMKPAKWTPKGIVMPKLKTYARGSSITRQDALKEAKKHRTSYKQVIEVWRDTV